MYYRVVNKSMTNQERNIIISIWDDVDLRQKLEDNPYSLTQDELVSLENNDRLNTKLKHLLADALIKKALIQVRS
ncbi:MAG: hypothetical protein ABR89_12435 [Rhodobacter sp. BACL10 MAG-120910-bin24]|nr:MAG: hypothetical protein ABR89_12435 [Rhodobacter sp. BACL10 MAG-120910-bin24]